MLTSTSAVVATCQKGGLPIALSTHTRMHGHCTENKSIAISNINAIGGRAYRAHRVYTHSPPSNLIVVIFKSREINGTSV